MSLNASLRRLAFLILPSLLLLVSCAQVPLASEQQRNAASGFRPQPGKAGVYVFRETGFVGSAIAYFVYVDGRLLGICGNGMFLYAEIDPGRHILSTDLTQFRDTSINVESGRVYFVRLSAYLQLSVGSPAPLRSVSQEEGRRGVTKCKQAASSF